jgi:predicted enzyme related to lactoylglutathione lyase
MTERSTVEKLRSFEADLIAENARLRAALQFYADPFDWKKKHDRDDDMRIPDFYSEMCFGDTAREALGLPRKGGS